MRCSPSHRRFVAPGASGLPAPSTLRGAFKPCVVHPPTTPRRHIDAENCPRVWCWVGAGSPSMRPRSQRNAEAKECLVRVPVEWTRASTPKLAHDMPLGKCSSAKPSTSIARLVAIWGLGISLQRARAPRWSMGFVPVENGRTSELGGLSGCEGPSPP